MRVRRTLRLRDAEVWKLELPFSCYLVILDLRRPSKPKDYPYLPPEDVEGRDNYIKVFTISDRELEEIDKVIEVVEDLISNVDQGFCDWNISRETRIVCSKEDIMTTINDILYKSIGIRNVLEDNRKYLSQD